MRNGIVINGVSYEAVDDSPNECCESCSLQKECNEHIEKECNEHMAAYGLCYLFGSDYHFELVGENRLN